MFRKKGHKLSRFVGQLEADIMEILWNQSPLPAKEIRLQLRLKKKLASTTVLTVLSRLVEKGHLRKATSGRSNYFRPTVSKKTFLQGHIQELLKDLQDEFPDEFKRALERQTDSNS